MTNDGLVSLDHVSGMAGDRLVPDLAAALPAPTDAGKIYAFHLRPGIRYSTNGTVTPSDVIHSFERLFAIGSSGTSWYQSIAGASACERHPARCDLSDGIVADDKADTVVFRLTRPDPEFLYKLALTFAYVLPGSTTRCAGPQSAARDWPIRISRYVPGHAVLLTRNPRYREWSAAAQPRGIPEPSRVAPRPERSARGRSGGGRRR